MSKRKKVRRSTNFGKYTKKKSKKKPEHDVIKDPKASILISLYQADDYIDEFLERLTHQSYLKNSECIFLINEDDIGDVTKKVKNFPFEKQVVEIQEVENLYTSWNRGIDLARGEYLINMNVDDYHMMSLLETHILALDSNPEFGLVYGICRYTNEAFSKAQVVHFNNISYSKVMNYVVEKNQRIVGCCPMWRKSLHEKYGKFDDETYKGAADHDMWIRLMLGGEKFGFIDALSSIQFLHKDTLTSRVNPNHCENEILRKKYGDDVM